MTNSPSKNKDRILSYTVYCNDNRLEDNYELVSASVRLELNRIGKATLTFNAENMEMQTFDETDADLFKPGNSIRLDIGDLNNEKTIFDGIITEVRMKISKGHRALMEIECRDYAYPATQERKNCIFEKKKDSDIIADILGSYGNVKVDPVLTVTYGVNMVSFDGGVDSTALKAELSRYRGKFSFYGSNEVIPGCLIELQGLVKRFNGNAFIGSVHHIIEDNEWITEVGMGVPNNNTAENNMKAFATRSQMKMEFDEDKKSIVFSTPGENRIEINDDGKCIKLTDLNKNEIIMDSNGISLISEKDIILKAKGNVMIDATAKTEIAAKSDISLNGANIKATAKVGFSAKGNASAELSAMGQTTIKGGMVMIN